jgi:type VI secretion system protein VasG
MLVGSSGIGKTETAHALADIMYGGDRNLITINMSEFQEPHSVATLKGAPPGYVGYGKGGVLTEAVRRAPYSVVLLDEVEKAHPDVLEVFYQVFDKGYMDDGEGSRVDFRHTIILLTGNVGGENILESAVAGETNPKKILDHIRPILSRTFHDAFLGRLNVIPYMPLPTEVLNSIVRLKLDQVTQRFAQRHNATLNYTDELVSHIAERCREVASGARNVDHIITRTLLPKLSLAVLDRLARGESFESAEIGVDEDGSIPCRLSP